MKRYRWLLGCCLFLSIGMLWAADEPDLRMLQQKAAQSRDMEAMSEFVNISTKRKKILNYSFYMQILFINWLQKARSRNNS